MRENFWSLLTILAVAVATAGCAFVPKEDYSRVLAQYEATAAENRNLLIENENLRTSWREAVDARIATENELARRVEDGATQLR